jgi:hypothetical protein
MAFKHFLNFLSLPSIGTIEIAEPIGFDGASYKVKQDDKRFGRDIIIANEDTELTFTRDFFEQIQIAQILPTGEMFDYASQGFDYLIDVFQNDGWEGKVEYIIEKDGTQFTTGVFSYYTSLVEFDNIKVKIIQNTNREIIKRLEDTDINAFNNKALDGRDITPCATTNILLKAKPIIQSGKWIYGISDITYLRRSDIEDLVAFNFSNNIIYSDLQNTLSFIQGAQPDGRQNFRYLYAANAFSNVILNISNLDVRLIENYNVNVLRLQLNWAVYDGIESSPSISNGLIAFCTPSNPFLTNYTVLIPEIPRGCYLSIFFIWVGESVIDNPILVEYHSMDVEIIGSSIGIDTIVKGIRLYDLAEHNTKSIADVDFIAPEYDVNGEHYNNFAFNGLLLGQITDKPFNNKFKDLMNFSDETCSDIQINPTSVELLPYAEYYTDNEIGIFDELPSYSTLSKFNKRYSLKTAEFKYKRSSDERATNGKNSIDDVHTETQKYITDSVDSNLKVEINHIRSAFLIEEARRRAFDNEQSKALENDDNLFLLKCVNLAPNTEGGFSSNLLMRVLDNGNVEILNNNTDGDGINFNWNLLGFGVGSQFFIDNGQNIGTYTVVAITNSVLTLDQVSGVTASYNGDALIKMRWYFTNVAFVNQTNETYSLIEGVSNPANYSNLDYHWARNIQRWYPYLATSTKFKNKATDLIKTASFKTNGSLVTRKSFPLETENVSDSGDIFNSDIASLKILNPFMHTVKVYADFTTITNLIVAIRDIKGYVSVNLNDGRMIKGYIQMMDYSWISEELDLTIEEKFISDYMTISLELLDSGKTITTIEQVGYPIKNNLKSFQINNIFVTLYDSIDNAIFAPTRFTNIKISGATYTDIIEFSDALTEFINAQNE